MTSDRDNIPADLWYEWLAKAKRLDRTQHWQDVSAERERIFREKARERLRRMRRRTGKDMMKHGN